MSLKLRGERVSFDDRGIPEKIITEMCMTLLLISSKSCKADQNHRAWI